MLDVAFEHGGAVATLEPPSNRTYDPDLGRFLQRDPIGTWGDGLDLWISI